MNQAVILAGGKATRMRPHTDDRPKAMVEIGGIPIVEHQIRWLTRNGIRDIVISCGYKAEVIQDRLNDGKALGASITYAVESEPLGRGGGLKFAAGDLPQKGARWLALNGDVLCDFPIAEMVVVHEASKATATIALAQYRSTWGIADLDGDLIKGFTQSPLLPYWVNGGVYCLEPKLAALLPDRGDHEDSTFPELAAEGKLAGYRIDGYWRGIDNAKDIIEATEDLSIAPTMLSKIEHVALAVSDLEAAIELYSKVWGMDLEHREVIPEQGVEEATLRIGDSYIQLLKPLSPDSIIGKFIERRGEGLHHIAYEVDDLKSELDRLKQEGAHLIDEEPKAGSRGRNIAFVHPKANRGLLVELVEREPDSK